MSKRARTLSGRLRLCRAALTFQGFNVILRLDSPQQGWFDKTWKPGDLELVN